ncbi:NADPH-dependent F420 reductase [Streptomyces malaysiensis]|uniref:NAD(P)-binding domain-containing protein n=1 Tax=Streptomyces malaysiensis subsp. samsunensis TaxID=459658 RepID=A0A9X2RWZ6_STRMQ|nr:NAD(P)-binding domain-containing protein [Streptomyces samsunensis]MCQ8833787.1 NAD(P)-binding domain-containing protein [Streptomyces samsunensis]
MTTLGFIGAGSVAGQVARKAVTLGYDVILSNARGPETLADLIAELGPTARAATVIQTAQDADVVMAGIPMAAYRDLPVAPLRGKIVIDAINYYPPRDGHIPALDTGETTTSGLVQQHLEGAEVAKGFNHIAAADITTDGRPSGTPGRRALTTASDFPKAAAFVTELYDRFGFDTVNLGPLSESWRAEFGRPAFLAAVGTADLRARLAEAPRIV